MYHHLNYFPLPLIFYAIFAGVLLALFILLQLKLLRYAYMRIGLDSRVAMLVLLGSLLGSYINIPVAQLAESRVASDEVIDFFGMRYVVPVEADWPGTIIAVNVGRGAYSEPAFDLLARAQPDLASWRRGDCHC